VTDPATWAGPVAGGAEVTHAYRWASLWISLLRMSSVTDPAPWGGNLLRHHDRRTASVAERAYKTALQWCALGAAWTPPTHREE
jgi:hypothetical protein